MKQIVAGGGVELNEALYYAYPNVIELIRRAVRLAIQDEVITEDEDHYLKYLIDILAVPEPYIQEVKGVLEEYKAALQIRSGILPTIQPGTKYLDVGELAHLECEAIYINTETKTLPRRQGVLRLTNQKLRFASPQTSFMVDWKKVLSKQFRDASSVSSDRTDSGIPTISQTWPLHQIKNFMKGYNPLLDRMIVLTNYSSHTN